MCGLVTVMLLNGACSNRQVEDRLAENELATNTLHTDVQALEQRVQSMEGRLSALSSDVGTLEVKTRKGKSTQYVVAPAVKAAPVVTPVKTATVASPASQNAPYVPLSASDVQPSTPQRATAPLPGSAAASAAVSTGPTVSLPPTTAPSPVQSAPASAPRPEQTTPASAPKPAQTAPQSTPRPASSVTPAPTAAATPIPAQAAVSLALPPESSTAVFGQPAAATAPSPAAPASTAAPAVAQSPATSAAPVSLAPLAPKVKGEEAAYNAALALARSGKTAEAIKRFTTFLQDYPTGRYAPNAYYWIGECLYAERNYADALIQFKDVAARYPRHHKTADALLKAGMTYDRLGDKDNAALQYKALTTDFPNSEAARRVKGRSAKR